MATQMIGAGGTGQYAQPLLPRTSLATSQPVTKIAPVASLTPDQYARRTGYKPGNWSTDHPESILIKQAILEEGLSADPATMQVLQSRLNKGKDTENWYGLGGPNAGQIVHQLRLEGRRAVDAAKPTAQDEQNALFQTIQNRQNPYDTNAEAFKQALFGAQSRAARAFDPQQQALSGSLAGRGMLGSGQEAASRAALGGAQAAQLADISTGAYQNAYQNAANWEDNRSAMLASLLGQKQGTEQFNKQFQLQKDAYDLQKRQAESNALWGPVGDVLKIGASVAPYVAMAAL